MKSCLSLTFVILVLITIVGGGGLLWYLSYTTEFSRQDTHTSALAPAKPAPPQTPAPPTTPPAPPTAPRR